MTASQQAQFGAVGGVADRVRGATAVKGRSFAGLTKSQAWWIGKWSLGRVIRMIEWGGPSEAWFADAE